jgi:hypothetical protein
MGSYFKPLRGKLGVVTLVLACLLMAGWVRSIFTLDQLRFRDLPTMTFQSASGHLRMWHDSSGEVTSSDLHFFEWQRSTVSLSSTSPFPGSTNHFGWIGFDFVQYPEQMSLRILPYWSIVIPLTLLSAWLLFSKPRTKRIESSESSH